jgi:hypothetical protein
MRFWIHHSEKPMKYRVDHADTPADALAKALKLEKSGERNVQITDQDSETKTTLGLIEFARAHGLE